MIHLSIKMIDSLLWVLCAEEGGAYLYLNYTWLADYILLDSIIHNIEKYERKLYNFYTQRKKTVQYKIWGKVNKEK